MPRSATELATSAPAFRRALATWFQRARRPLPWRTERSLYRTVVSEFMLQQTQVATVLPYFDRWMRALPDFAALAAAREETVVKLWEGLGYYRRARFLHQLAKELVMQPLTLAHGPLSSKRDLSCSPSASNGSRLEAGARARLASPAFSGLGEKAREPRASVVGAVSPPRTAAEWADLPGIGPYTAAAIASLAFDDPAACVDGNVVRILARLTDESRAFPDGSSAVKHFTPLAGALLDRRSPGRHNEAMMELGATICVRRNPRCDECPVARFCAARAAGTANDRPRIARAATVQSVVERIWCVRGEEILLHRIPDDAARMRGLHELPTAAQAGVPASALTPEALVATHRRAITRFQITERIFRVDAPDIMHETAPVAWFALSHLTSITLSGPHRRWVESLLRAMNHAPKGCMS